MLLFSLINRIIEYYTFIYILELRDCNPNMKKSHQPTLLKVQHANGHLSAVVYQFAPLRTPEIVLVLLHIGLEQQSLSDKALGLGRVLYNEFPS